MQETAQNGTPTWLRRRRARSRRRGGPRASAGRAAACTASRRRAALRTEPVCVIDSAEAQRKAAVVRCDSAREEEPASSTGSTQQQATRSVADQELKQSAKRQAAERHGRFGHAHQFRATLAALDEDRQRRDEARGEVEELVVAAGEQVARRAHRRLCMSQPNQLKSPLVRVTAQVAIEAAVATQPQTCRQRAARMAKRVVRT